MQTTPLTKNMKIFFVLFLFFSFSKATFSQEALSASAVEEIRQANILNKVPEYDGVKIKYEVVFNSVKVSYEDSLGIVQDLSKIPGGVDCEFNPKTYLLVVRADKSNKYLNIVGIQNVLLAHNLHLMTFQEILYKK